MKPSTNAFWVGLPWRNVVPSHLTFMRPMLILPLRQCHRRSGPHRPFPATAAAHFQALLPIGPRQLRVVRLQSFDLLPVNWTILNYSFLLFSHGPEGVENDEGIAVFGRAEGVYFEAGADGTPVAEICQQVGISQATNFNWQKKYEGLTPPEMRRPKQLEDMNAKLKKLVADLSLDREVLQDVIHRKL